ncbi:glycosyltransferase [Nesterenkonia halophila]|uniref:glycosyltransferase family protein n=1 Tax=Nesterenkonia halophila TaxID=302044 RepID=UPI001291D00A|nr:glycosyltransferase [Nesterenkonia halophila]
MTITVALYSHDSVGLGHARRNRAVAHALAAGLPRITGHRVRGLLIAGHPGAAADSLPPGWDWMVLPGFSPAVEGYAARHLEMSSARLSRLRRSAVAAALESLAPDLFIVDRHPFGIDGELAPSLDQLRLRGTRCVLGLREVLDSPEAASREWSAVGAGAVADSYDAVWIYGDPRVHDPIAAGEVPRTLADRTEFTGYLARGRPADACSGPADEDGAHEDAVDEDDGDGADVLAASAVPSVLTTVGGGADGGRLAAAAAAAPVPAGHRHLIITGPQMSRQDHDAVVRAAAEARRRPGPVGRVRVQRRSPHLPQLIRDARAVISMAGYNSAAEILDSTTPALFVPRSTRRAEQPRRAAALAASGAADMLEAAAATPQRLGDWLAEAVSRRTTREHIDRDGLARLPGIAARQLRPTTPATTTPTTQTVQTAPHAAHPGRGETASAPDHRTERILDHVR